MNRCDADRNQDYALDVLSAEERRAHERHLQRCPACAEEVVGYRALFEELRDLPQPSVPPGIPDAVLARLMPEKLRDRIRRRLEPLLDRPLGAALAGGLVGLLIAVLYRPALLFAGRAAGGLFTDGTRWLVGGLDRTLQHLLELTVLLEIAAGWLQKIAPVLRFLGEAAPVLVEQYSWSSFILSLATLMGLRLLFVQTQREEFGHVRKH
ncbi:MAG: hypothetical protein GF346_00360 [Candidatus Eisenbacteria bacterium]|nr:hypothetical protein [Candidatus Eisenbacteria bacterium]